MNYLQNSSHPVIACCRNLKTIPGHTLQQHGVCPAVVSLATFCPNLGQRRPMSHVRLRKPKFPRCHQALAGLARELHFTGALRFYSLCFNSLIDKLEPRSTVRPSPSDDFPVPASTAPATLFPNARPAPCPPPTGACGL